MVVEPVAHEVYYYWNLPEHATEQQQQRSTNFTATASLVYS